MPMQMIPRFATKHLFALEITCGGLAMISY
jgi:hypothetical protein